MAPHNKAFNSSNHSYKNLDLYIEDTLEHDFEHRGEKLYDICMTKIENAIEEERKKELSKKV